MTTLLCPSRPRARAIVFALVTAVASAAAGCAGTTPATRYYDLAAPAARAGGDGPVLAIEPLATDDAYDDERIVYRPGRYRLDYYDYHRWSAPPGVMIGNYLERGLEGSGLFAAVVREGADEAGGLLTGRVVAIEEVDVSKTDWRGRLVVELRLLDPRSGDTLWSEQYEETERLERQSPEGLAAAITRAMERIVNRAAPAIHERLTEHLARADDAAAR